MNMQDIMSYKIEMKPIKSMEGRLELFIEEKVLVEVENIIKENKGKFPNAISKEMYKRKLNNIVKEIFRNEERIKSIIDRNLRINGSLDPYCTRALSDFTNYIMITEFMKRGCNHCF